MKIKKIIISGCSFIHGDDICHKKFNIPAWSPLIIENLTEEQKEYFENVRISGQLKKQIDCEVVNLGLCGATNSQIVNSIFEYISNNESSLDPDSTLIIVGWTESGRYQFFLNNGIYFGASITQINNYIEAFAKQSDVKYSKERKKFIKFLEKISVIEQVFLENSAMAHFLKIHHLELINLLQMYLEKSKFNYLFFNSFGHFPINKNDRDPGFIFEKFVNWKNWFPYADERSYDYSWYNTTIWNNKDLHTETYHPSELAVEKFAEELASFIRKKY